jgi:hypothetical protein
MELGFVIFILNLKQKICLYMKILIQTLFLIVLQTLIFNLNKKVKFIQNKMSQAYLGILGIYSMNNFPDSIISS